ncbi:primosomal protein N' family DNA-binding protein, partial [Cumulibacter manganitolerans]
MPLAHLDRLFDYRIPPELAADVAPGSKVRVRFAGKLVDAYVIGVAAETDHHGTLSPIERVSGAEPVLTAETIRLLRAVADRWAGSFADVARLAVPPRNAKAEQSSAPPHTDYPMPGGDGWAPYGGGFLTALAERRRARAVWNAMPGEDWPARLAEAAAATAAGGRGAVLVVPDVKDAARVEAALAGIVGAGYAELNAGLGPGARYRRFLRCLRGEVRIAVGTRSAVYAPVRDLGLVAVWDDGDDLYDEPRAPYAHTRDVAVLRAHLTGASVLIGGFAQSVAASDVETSGADSVAAP